MLRIGSKDLIYSTSFLIAQDEEVSFKVPEIIARSIKIVAKAIEPGATGFHAHDTESELTLTLPFAEHPFYLELKSGQLNTKKGPVTGRIFGQVAGPFRFIHIDLHEGRYDNYVGE